MNDVKFDICDAQTDLIENKPQRIPGLHQGMGWISDNFDDPLPDEFWLGEEEATNSTPTDH